MKTLHKWCAGLDVHKVEVVACLRLISKRKVEQEVRRFPTTIPIKSPKMIARSWSGGPRVLARGGQSRSRFDFSAAHRLSRSQIWWLSPAWRNCESVRL